MELKLKVISGKQAGVEIAIVGPKFMIGRADDNHLRPHSDAISRHHCELLVEGGNATIRDLGSRNGTYVNGQRIQEQQRLKAGDKLSIGQLQFEVHLVPELGGPKRPKVLDTQDAAKRLKSTPAPATHDADVAAWLTEDSSTPKAHDTSQISAADTRQLAQPGSTANDTTTLSDVQIPGAEGAQEAWPADAQDDGTPDDPSKPSKGPKPMGKLPTPPPAADSRAAAADFLKKMAKYR